MRPPRKRSVPTPRQREHRGRLQAVTPAHSTRAASLDARREKLNYQPSRVAGHPCPAGDRKSVESGRRLNQTPTKLVPPEPMRKYITEFIGTFFLVLTIGCTVIPGRRESSRRWPSARC